MRYCLVVINFHTKEWITCSTSDPWAHMTIWTHIKKIELLKMPSSPIYSKKKSLSLAHDQVSISSLSLSSLIFSSGSFNFSIHEINFEFWIILHCLYFFVINIYTLSHLFSKLQIMYFVFHIPFVFFLLYTLNPVANHGFHLFWSPPPMEVNLD